MKPFEEQMRSKAKHPYPDKGWHSELSVPLSDALRILRKCAKIVPLASAH